MGVLDECVEYGMASQGSANAAVAVECTAEGRPERAEWERVSSPEADKPMTVVIMCFSRFVDGVAGFETADAFNFDRW